MKTFATLTDDRLDAAVRRLDPASASLTPTEQHHADDLKARILMSGPDSNILGRPPGPGDELPSPKPRRRRLVLAGGAVVAVTAGLIAAPLFGDEERRPTAWSAVPTALSGGDARELGEGCLETTEKLISRPHSGEANGSFAPEQRRAMKVVVGERRGPYDFVILGNPAGFELTCLRHVTEQSPGASGSMFPLAAPAVTSISVSGHAQSIEGIKDGRFQRETATAVFGRVGADVTGVTLSTSAGPVTASVTNGWFAAVWPSTDPVDGDPYKDVTITLKLADETTTAPAAFDSFPGVDVPAELREPAPGAS